MNIPVTGPALLPLGILFGFIFGWLLQRARLTDTNVIIAQLRLRDYTLFKVMLTAIIVGGIGVFFLHSGGLAAYHIKPANLLAVAVGAVLFGIGMAIYGYCPGTGLAAIGTGSWHALAGAVGMLARGSRLCLFLRLDQGCRSADRSRRRGSLTGADRRPGSRMVRRTLCHWRSGPTRADTSARHRTRIGVAAPRPTPNDIAASLSQRDTETQFYLSSSFVRSC